MEALKHTRD